MAFGCIPGELCLKSADFRTEVTKFCQACQHQFGNDEEVMKICSQVLERVGKYTILLQEKKEHEGDIFHKPMAPTILADIGARQITRPSDRLAIVANCCNFDTRLNSDELSDGSFSHCLALLTQHLLNGELVNNGQSHNDVCTRNIFEFLKNESLDSFISPIKEELNFIKSSRLTEV
jgi:hypothetical protein